MAIHRAILLGRRRESGGAAHIEALERADLASVASSCPVRTIAWQEYWSPEFQDTGSLKGTVPSDCVLETRLNFAVAYPMAGRGCPLRVTPFIQDGTGRFPGGRDSDAYRPLCQA